MIVADASWIIALRDPSDPHHQSAREMNAASADEDVLLHPVTLAECLVGPAALGLCQEAVAGARAAFEIVEVDAGAPVRWAELRVATRLRLPDVIVLDTAIGHRASAILTFDRGLADAAQTYGIAAAPTPAEPEGE